MIFRPCRHVFRHYGHFMGTKNKDSRKKHRKPFVFGRPSRDRTCDPRIKSPIYWCGSVRFCPVTVVFIGLRVRSGRLGRKRFGKVWAFYGHSCVEQFWIFVDVPDDRHRFPRYFVAAIIITIIKRPALAIIQMPSVITPNDLPV